MAGMRRPVAVIIGMMGAGKTRVGKEAAQMMQLPFADADNEIEHDAGMKIPEYFERYGEPEFRKLESDVVLDMLEDFDGIFSLGGGAPMTPSIQQGLAEYIADGGKVVYLMADPKEAMERANRGGGRPMLNGRRQRALGRSCTRNATRCSDAWPMCRCAPTDKPRKWPRES